MQYTFINIDTFLVLIAAVFIGNFIWWLMMETAKCGVSPLSRIKYSLFNCLAIVRADANELFLQGKSEKEVYNDIQQRFKNESYLFLRKGSSSSKHNRAVAIISHIIQDFDLFKKFVLYDLNFSKKTKKEIDTIIKIEQKEWEAKMSLKHILIDESDINVESAFIWFPALFMKPYICDSPETHINDGENVTSVLFYLQGEYLKEGVKYSEYQDCLNKLSQVYPRMIITKSTGTISKNSKVAYNNEKRKEAMLDFIRNKDK